MPKSCHCGRPGSYRDRAGNWACPGCWEARQRRQARDALDRATAQDRLDRRAGIRASAAAARPGGPGRFM
jgi:hypothetical protein